ncbi:hypothetical protein Goari_025258, partial [Gossypium aridum]|nr:hypothetical protein [Gossypium aridum]
CEAIAKTVIHDLKDCPISREGKEDKGQTIWERSSNISKVFRIYNILNEPLLSQNEAIKKWEKPQNGIVKINFNASINVNRMGYDIIIRDDDGFVLGGGGGFMDKRVTVHEVKCIAFERGIELVCQLNINDDMLFETDHASLVNNMHNYGTNVTIIGAKIPSTTSSLPT